VLVVLAGTLATATFSVSALLRDTANAAARTKADTFVGADMAIDVAGDHVVPAGLADRATVIARASGDASTTPVDALAIDPATCRPALARSGCTRRRQTWPRSCNPPGFPSTGSRRRGACSTRSASS